MGDATLEEALIEASLENPFDLCRRMRDAAGTGVIRALEEFCGKGSGDPAVAEEGVSATRICVSRSSVVRLPSGLLPAPGGSDLEKRMASYNQWVHMLHLLDGAIAISSEMLDLLQYEPMPPPSYQQKVKDYADSRRKTDDRS